MIYIEKIYDMKEMMFVLSTLTDENDLDLLRTNIILAHKTIQHYLNATEDDLKDDKGKGIYSYEVVNLAAYILNREGTSIASKKQGERSISYHNNREIPQHIKMMLPLPYARSL